MTQWRISLDHNKFIQFHFPQEAGFVTQSALMKHCPSEIISQELGDLLEPTTDLQTTHSNYGKQPNLKFQELYWFLGRTSNCQQKIKSSCTKY